MKILFCSQTALDARLGAPKAIMELAASLEALGCRCRLVSDEETSGGALRGLTGYRRGREYARSLGRFLERHAGDYDAVDYDHVHLPFSRRRFAPSTLFVARSPLLIYRLERIRIPRAPGVRPLVGAIVKWPARRANVKLLVRRSLRTCREADLVNVSNDDDRLELVRRGIDTSKIATLPFGLDDARLSAFGACSSSPPEVTRVAFVGTFDARKGAHEFPEIVRRVVASVPACKFRLLGARYRSEGEVLAAFPSDLRSHIEVISNYEPSELPGLLADCSVGIFPSHMEGFGFGVLEMLAASLPVVAYDAPGPPVMLPPEYLVPAGAAAAMAARVVALLMNPVALLAARAWARTRAGEFTWRRAAKLTLDIYTERLARLRERPTME